MKVRFFSVAKGVVPYGWRGVPALVAVLFLSVTAFAAALPSADVKLEGAYSGHLQDVWYAGGETIWWAHTKQILKTDLAGHILARRDVQGHHAGCEVRDGKLYVAVCPLQKKGQKKSEPTDRLQVNVYNAETLEPCGEHVFSNIVDRAGSLAILPDGSFVVGCLRPPDIAKDQVRFHHISPDFKLIRSVVLGDVTVPLGIETIKYRDGELYLCPYANGGLTIVVDAKTFEEKRRVRGFIGATGFAFVDGCVYVARTKKDGAKGWCSSLRRAPDETAARLSAPRASQVPRASR